LLYFNSSKEESSAHEKETSIREITMMTTGGGELFSEDSWSVRAEIKKKRAYAVSVQILIEFDLARKRDREHKRKRRIRLGKKRKKNVNLF